MMRQGYSLPANKKYILNVINELEKKKGINHEQAKKLLIKYYRPLKRNWGHELNVEQFADKVIYLDQLVSTALEGKSPNNGNIIEWKSNDSRNIRRKHQFFKRRMKQPRKYQ